MGQKISGDNAAVRNELPVFLNDLLALCDWPDRLKLPYICQKWRCYSKLDEYYHWLCICLVNDSSFYIPLALPRGESWKKIFFDFYPYRNIWKGGPQHEIGLNVRSKVNVYARFRPLPIDSSNVENEQPTITLPLHQRLHLIRLSRNINSNRKALQVLKDEGNWFGAKWSAIQNARNGEHLADGEGTRGFNDLPMGEKESAAPLIASVQNIDPGTGKVMMIAAGNR